jgi:hypothetical protein
MLIMPAAAIAPDRFLVEEVGKGEKNWSGDRLWGTKGVWREKMV